MSSAAVAAAASADCDCDFLWVRLNSFVVAAPRPYGYVPSVPKSKTEVSDARASDQWDRCSFTYDLSAQYCIKKHCIE